MAYPLPDKPSIAVLPFDNLSGDPNQDYLSDGITEEIITSLSKVPQLFVIARKSAFTYKGKPAKVQNVAEELGVRYVLEGSVRKSGDRIRITAQLVDAIKGYHLWAERYDRDFKDLFALQDEITMKISSALRLKLTEGERARSYAKGTKNLRAYEKVLQARELHLRFDKNANIMARKICEEAITLDPGYAQAYGLLGNIHLMDNILGISKNPRESLKRAHELEKKALGLDDTLPVAHVVLSFIYAFKKHHDKSIEHAEHAVALEPGSATCHGNLGRSLAYAGRYNEAIEALEKAIRMDPFPENWYFIHLSDPYINLDKHEEALAVVKRGLDISPNARPLLQRLVIIYSLTGRDEEASAVAAKLIKLHPKFTIESWAKRAAFKDQAVIERYVKAMRKAGLPEKPPLPLPEKPSIAVLPFANMSEDPKQEYFSDGITEEIITALSKVPQLFVIARNSTFTYKGKPVKVQHVGRELGVRYVLEGSVRTAGDRVRITTQLVDASTGNHLWSERYDRELKDIFALQDEITMKILTALRVKLTEGEQARMWAGTDNLEAYLKVLQGRKYLYRLNIDDNALAREMLKEAIALDPNYADAYRYLAVTHMVDVFLGSSKSPRQSLAQAIELAQKAIALDANLPEAHAQLGWLFTIKRQYEKGIAEAELAVALDPNSAYAHWNLGRVLTFAGKPEEAIAFFKKGVRLNPIPPSAYFMTQGFAYLFMGQYEQGIAASKKAAQIQANNVFAHIILAANYSMLGREEEARGAAAEVVRIQPKFSLERYVKLLPVKNQADKERVINALRKAGLK
jgi:TolB-like protein/lipoprotein NlpI